MKYKYLKIKGCDIEFIKALKKDMIFMHMYYKPHQPFSFEIENASSATDTINFIHLIVTARAKDRKSKICLSYNYLMDNKPVCMNGAGGFEELLKECFYFKSKLELIGLL